MNWGIWWKEKGYILDKYALFSWKYFYLIKTVYFFWYKRRLHCFTDEDEDPGDSYGPDLRRSLSFIDELTKSYDLDNDDIVALNDIQGKLKNLRLKSLKQSKISSFFQWRTVFFILLR